ncbi:carbon-nitrogen hydrolase family protein [Nitratifractor sp.]|uniref:carbon-nitrogen hydrolase family protein n=1 Tax=Nitratifractor sp. TaxID=2268144 RepID=UPI0025F4EC2D|nr:carbon-nitrogen hydrolase family protein [Nitratifractor sp.]
MKTLTVAALQLPTLGMNATRLEFYLKNATERGARVILLGEYVLNHFFRELEGIPRSMVKEQSRKHTELLQRLAKEYDVVFVAPIVRIEKKRYYKTIAKIGAKKVDYYRQQILIPYDHWNEAAFFSNEVAPLKDPMIFRIDGFRIAVLGGYELHFDPLWERLDRRKVDLVLLPTASTFGSHNRWRTLIKGRAFLHGVYILRANRLGEFSEGENRWRFYGDSMLVDPEGEVEMMLEDKESMLVETIEKKAVKEHRKSWRFREALEVRGAL